MRRFLLVCLTTATFARADWVQIRSGPFELFSDANPRAARETLASFEQFRYALGQALSKPELLADPAIRILFFKTGNELSSAGSPSVSITGLIQGRDRFVVPLGADSSIPQQAFAECTRIFLERNVDRLPQSMERGLAQFFSTIEVHGTRVTWGAPPANRTRDWARVHLLIANPENFAKSRVLLFNLQKGMDEDPAYRNALGQSRIDFEAEVDRYWKAGIFPASSAPSRPLSPERDLRTIPLEAEFVELATADLLNDHSRARYKTMLRENSHVAEAHEGLALLALRGNDAAEARDQLTRAIEAGSRNPLVLIDYARIEADPAKARAALAKAVEVAPNSAEAHYLLGEKTEDVSKKISEWTSATKLAPRNGKYWESLANLYLERKNFSEAAKAWRAAEQAAATGPEREQMHQARLAIERQRLDYEEAERKRIAEEKERDIQRLKAKAIADLRGAEAKANGTPLAADAVANAVPWWDGPKPAGHVEGLLKQVDCIGKQARIVIEKDSHKLTRLLVRDPSQVVFIGGGERTLTCGPQKSVRAAVEFTPKMNPKLGTSGEVATIEFLR